MVMRAPRQLASAAKRPAGGWWGTSTGGPSSSVKNRCKSAIKVAARITLLGEAAAITCPRQGHNAATRGTGQTPIWMAGVQIDWAAFRQAPSDGRPACRGACAAENKAVAASWVGPTGPAADDAAMRELLKRPTGTGTGDDSRFGRSHGRIPLGGQDDLANYELRIRSERQRRLLVQPRDKPVHPHRIARAGAGCLPPVQAQPDASNPDADFVKANYDVVIKTVQGRAGSGQKGAARNSGAWMRFRRPRGRRSVANSPADRI